jgi:hypothetical protein
MADGGDEQVKILDGASGEVLSSFDRPGHQIGEFTHAHMQRFKPVLSLHSWEAIEIFLSFTPTFTADLIA